MDNEYAKFFLNRKVDVYQLECIELSHPSFLNTYRVVRNDDRGVYVKHKEGSGQFYYEYLPLTIQRSGMLGDLDQTLTVSVSGLGDILPDEFERVLEGQYADVKPTVNYRLYSSDNLNTPIHYLLGLQLAGVSMNNKAVTFKAESPRLNTSKTGDIFSLDRFSGLKGAV
ncbi:DUF1833 family protein [Acinetobacter pittii]|uniref:DUF1833 family protein n=1 Tax=Acinetobacter pittii TaxID=48296 RepID=UPI0010233292|nr:DUF1833 family protein [Acinetobacter pittii]MBN6526639.1 DUF1833 family protein [Acinetobacter pittii]RZG79472.1 DUF1833 domain-containing protein [Acinetobacter pittii]RZH52893.1 DUF1833 domain-containing protein [Acinetobacter pittii]RZH57469.1 DUF1833 domain-containing protein [Acinetobacter pittii]